MSPKLRTPGIWRSSLLTARVVRCISAADVPGCVTQWIKKSRSLKPGNNDWPSSGVSAMPTTVTSRKIAYARRGLTTIRDRAAVYPRCRTVTTGDVRRSILGSPSKINARLASR
jgi:hypothetical protein